MYEIQHEIGKGGFGTVYAGLHKLSRVPCAIKIIEKSRARKIDPDLKQLRMELKTLKQITHPHIVRIYGILDDL